MDQHGDCTSSFNSAMSLSDQGVSSIPQCYILPPSQRPGTYDHVSISTTLPIIDLSNLREQSLRSQTINEIRIACKEFGVFQVKINTPLVCIS